MLSVDVAADHGSPAGPSSSSWISGARGARASARRVLEWNPSTGYRVLHDTTGHYLRVVRVGSENWLLEQDVGEDEPFEPEIRRLVWDGERFRETVAPARAARASASTGWR